jgi:predicted transcriptional regulator YdeE
VDYISDELRDIRVSGSFGAHECTTLVEYGPSTSIAAHPPRIKTESKTMKLKNRDALHLVGLYVIAPIEELSAKVPAANERMLARLDEVDGRTGEHLISVSLGVEDDVYTQFLGVHVQADAEPPQGMETLELPSARWVQFTHHGPAQGIGSSFYTMRQWADRNDHPTEHVFVEFHLLEGDGPIDLLVRLSPPTQESEQATQESD